MKPVPNPIGDTEREGSSDDTELLDSRAEDGSFLTPRDPVGQLSLDAGTPSMEQDLFSRDDRIAEVLQLTDAAGIIPSLADPAFEEEGCDEYET